MGVHYIKYLLICIPRYNNCHKLFTKIFKKVFVFLRFYVYIKMNMVYKAHPQLNA